jgi:hypothetical protein
LGLESNLEFTVLHVGCIAYGADHFYSQVYNNTVIDLLEDSGLVAEERSCNATRLRAIFEAIVDSPTLGDVYYLDGLGDGSLVAEPVVRELLRCPKISGPILIDYLPDDRLTSARVRHGPDGKQFAPVTVGSVAMDLLRFLATEQSIVFEPSRRQDDGYCGGFRDGYCFVPTVFLEQRGEERASAVRERWRAGLEAGDIAFRFPDWIDE